MLFLRNSISPEHEVKEDLLSSSFNGFHVLLMVRRASSYTPNQSSRGGLVL
jgi:hypothetical protein